MILLLGFKIEIIAVHFTQGGSSRGHVGDNPSFGRSVLGGRSRSPARRSPQPVLGASESFRGRCSSTRIPRCQVHPKHEDCSHEDHTGKDSIFHLHVRSTQPRVSRRAGRGQTPPRPPAPRRRAPAALLPSLASWVAAPGRRR